ncbi:TetR/AcrR family transcriptional regulator [Frigoribacterium faeni]|uniref:AcrR family transcriptional regulator n=1 Tax=Frigoribacterium faeni TaxID=145483 RepID=A0A7W3JFD1_9MICO|nr:TetR/AcrR family transcriptional regulator [Frigoribacterium faeni]MBA8811847.1 AcrR family transcriptional regulator [Frigoribacterium faeni]GEK84436.1 TetR family transcriptional regulator [Frigoribacterium faeni]
MTTARPGRVRSEAARLAILDATRDELAERGYDKLSLDRIAAAAGVGKATIYRWYPHKGALVAEGMLSEHLLPRVPVADTGDVRADVHDWLRASLASLRESEVGGLIRATIAATAEDADVAAQYEARVTSLTRTALSDRLEVGRRAGRIRDDAPIAAMVESLIGTVLLHVLTRREADPAALDAIVGLLFDGVAPTR